MAEARLPLGPAFSASADEADPTAPEADPATEAGEMGARFSPDSTLRDSRRGLLRVAVGVLAKLTCWSGGRHDKFAALPCTPACGFPCSPSCGSRAASVWCRMSCSRLFRLRFQVGPSIRPNKTKSSGFSTMVNKREVARTAPGPMLCPNQKAEQANLADK